MATSDKYVRKSVPLVSPDPSSLRDSLKEFLKGQNELADYDFDGSVIATILDLLMYNTHFNAFYLNMIGNEAFLATAARRDSVVERAKLVGYTPRSARSARAYVALDFDTSSSVGSLTLTRGKALFSTSNLGQTFNFSVNETVTVLPDTNGDFTINSLNIVEGKFLTQTYKYLSSSQQDGFVLPSQNIDATTLRVRVTESDGGNITYTYDLYDDIVEVGSSSRVYFQEEVEGGYLKVIFGDGVIGKRPMIGDTIEISYFVSSGEQVNGAYNFKFAGNVAGATGATVKTISAASGASDPESIESIKFTAPKSYEAQNRAVTEADYAVIVRKNFTNVEDVSVWGGETAEPPKYGFVFISVKPKLGTILGDSEKDDLVAMLTKYNVTSITPQIVDPDYIYLILESQVNFDATQTDLGKGGIESLVQGVIFDYVDNSLDRFDKALRNSVLTRVIDSSEASIINSNVLVTLQKRMFPALGQPTTVELKFSNVLKSGTVTSTPFTYNGLENCFFKAKVSDPSKIDIVRSSNNVDITIQSSVGTVDYETGTITISSVAIQAIPDVSQYKTIDGIPFVGINVEPDDEDVFPQFNQILTTEQRNISVSAIAETNYKS